MSSAAESSNLVSDAVPDPPRLSEYNFENQQLNNQEEQSNQNAPPPQAPLINDDSDKYKKNSSSKSSKTSDTKYQKSKGTSKPKKSASTTINYNIVNSANIKIGPRFKHVYNLNNIQHYGGNAIPKECDSNSQSTTATEESKDMTADIKALSTSKLEISKENMLLIKTHIGNNWKKVAKHIGYSKGQIEQFCESYKHKGNGEVTYQILLDWKQSRTKDATIGHIISAMWSSQEYDCAEILAAAHNNI